MQKEVKLNKNIIDMIMTDRDYELIKSQSTWVEEKNTYQVPPFLFKEKQVKFPRLPVNQGRTSPICVCEIK